MSEKPTKLYLKPALGEDGAPVVVRDPLTRERLPDDGARKPRTRYWLRRIADGSVVEVEPKRSKKES